MFSLEKFRLVIINKQWVVAWDIATHWWFGSNYKRQTVLFEMLRELLEKNEVKE